MRRLALAIAFASVIWSAKASAEQQARPRLGDACAIAQGRSLFGSRCSFGHGMDARGTRAPDITAGDWRRAPDDAALARIVRDGIPGTEMNGTALHDDEVSMVVAYLRT